MKKVILAFVLGLASYPLVVDVLDVANYYADSKTVESAYYKVWMPTYHIGATLTKSCTKDVSKNGHGWVFVNREYYRCNKLQIAISDYLFGEKARPEPESKR